MVIALTCTSVSVMLCKFPASAFVMIGWPESAHKTLFYRRTRMTSPLSTKTLHVIKCFSAIVDCRLYSITSLRV